MTVIDLFERNGSETAIEAVERVAGLHELYPSDHSRLSFEGWRQTEEAELIPGLFFTLLATSWFYQFLVRSTRKKLNQDPSKISRLISLLPWEGVTGLVLSGLAILASVVVREEEEDASSMVARVTLYLGFSLPSLLSTLTFYSAIGRLALPRSSGLVATSLAFSLELLLPPSSATILLVVIAASALLSLTRVVLSSSPSSSSFLLLCLLTQSQGSWLIHSSLTPPSPAWEATYFSWHILAIFLIYTAIIFTLQSLLSRKKEEEKTVKSRVSPTTTLSSATSTVGTTGQTESLKVAVPKPSLNTSTLQFVKEKEFKEFIKENPSIKEFIRDRQELLSPKIFEKQPETTREAEVERSVSGLVRVLDCEPSDRLDAKVEGKEEPGRKLEESRLEGIRRSRRNSLEGLVDRPVDRTVNKVVDRVSPLEEFNALHRHHPGVRASIKLKESDLV